MQKLIITITLIIFISGGCTALKKADAGKNAYDLKDEKEILSLTINNNISDKNFEISKAVVSMNQGGENEKILVALRHKAPDTTLMIIKSWVGVEAARVLLTKDTIIINDRINKKLITGKPEKIKKKFGFDPGMFFIVLGDLIRDNGREAGADRCNKGTLNEQFTLNGREVEYRIDCSRRKVVNAEIKEDIRNSRVTINFDRFVTVNNVTVPQKIEMIDEDMNSEIKVSIEKITVGWNGNILFIPGRGYEIIRLR